MPKMIYLNSSKTTNRQRKFQRDTLFPDRRMLVIDSTGMDIT